MIRGSIPLGAIMTKYIMTNDDFIEILHNELLKNRPYLIRFRNYNNEMYEMRATEEDIKSLTKMLEESITSKGEDLFKEDEDKWPTNLS